MEDLFMNVYVKAKSPTYRRSYRAFHKSPDCRELTKPPPKGVAHEVECVPLADLDRVLPCKRCWPDAPRARSARRYCFKCNKSAARACPHNGGVPVWQTAVVKRTTLLQDPGDTWTRLTYVWPDKAHHYYK